MLLSWWIYGGWSRFKSPYNPKLGDCTKTRWEHSTEKQVEHIQVLVSAVSRLFQRNGSCFHIYIIRLIDVLKLCSCSLTQRSSGDFAASSQLVEHRPHHLSSNDRQKQSSSSRLTLHFFFFCFFFYIWRFGSLLLSVPTELMWTTTGGGGGGGGEGREKAAMQRGVFHSAWKPQSSQWWRERGREGGVVTPWDLLSSSHSPSPPLPLPSQFVF